MTDVATFTLERYIEADPETVFAAWTEAAKARGWLFTSPGREAVRCDIDARVGGRFIIVDRAEDGDQFHVGEFLEFNAPTRLKFRYREGRSESSSLERSSQAVVTCIPFRTGCQLTFVHRADEGAREEGEAARRLWERQLDMLAARLGSYVAGPDVEPFDGGMAEV
ncbi:SRPBCC family protein [Maricaulis sp. CAU 1757]